MAIAPLKAAAKGDLALVTAAALSSAAFLLGFSGLTILNAVLTAIAMLVLVRFTTFRWQSLVIAAVVPEVATTLVTVIRFPDDASVTSYGELVTYTKTGAAVFATLFLVLVTAAGWLGDRLRPGTHLPSSLP